MLCSQRHSFRIRVAFGLNEQQREIYTVMQQLKGNKPYLWEEDYRKYIVNLPCSTNLSFEDCDRVIEAVLGL